MIKESWIVKILDFYLCCFSSYLPSSNLLGFKSTPMIREAPEIRAPSAAWNMRINYWNTQFKRYRGVWYIYTHTHIYIYWIISFQSTEEENQEKSNLTARPTAPNPKTATVDPFVGFATFIVAPRPFFFLYRHKNKIKLLDSLSP